MIEAPLELQQSLTIPDDHYAACAAASPSPTPTLGNAAGNTADLLDLSGQPSPPGRLPDGFTARGIVALVFSCIAGIVGILVVSWYGLIGDGSKSPAVGGSNDNNNSTSNGQQRTIPHGEEERNNEVEQVTATSKTGGSIPLNG